MWQHITCSHCSQKKLHPSCKQQYVYNQSKDESVFHWLFLSSKICCCLRLISLQLVQCDYLNFCCKCHLQLKISRKDQFWNGHFLLMYAQHMIYLILWVKSYIIESYGGLFVPNKFSKFHIDYVCIYYVLNVCEFLEWSFFITCKMFVNSCHEIFSILFRVFKIH